jgi:hypothetical protein
MNTIKITLTKDGLYNKLFKRIDAEVSNGTWGQLGGTKISTENEYSSDGGYVVEFKRLPSAVLDWIKTQKNMLLSD